MPAAAVLVLLATFVVLLFNSGMRFSLGLLLVPMADDLQWSRTAVSSMASVFMFITAASLPFTGQLVDRLGAFRVLTAGVVLGGVALVLTSRITEPWHGYLTYGVLFALASAATSITPVGVILTRIFPERAGLANSFAISGMGLGQLIIVSILSAWLVQLGWRSAYVGLGVISVVILLPLLYRVAGVYRVAPSDTQLAVPTADRASAVGDQANTVETDPPLPDDAVNGTADGGLPAARLTLKGAMKLPQLWLVMAVYAICGFQDFFVATHIVALAIDANVSVAVAGQMLAFMGLAGLGGVLLAGFMSDRWGPVSVTLLCFILRCVLFIATLVSREPWIIITAALLYGSTFWMTAPLTVVFAKQLVGISLLGAVSGIITMVHHGAGGLGAAFGALGFDQTGDYQSGLVAMLALSVLAAFLTLRIRTGD